MAKGSTSARGRGQGTMITSSVPIGAALMTSRLPSWYRLTGVSSFQSLSYVLFSSHKGASNPLFFFTCAAEHRCRIRGGQEAN